MFVFKVGVVGAGTMGAQIAQAIAAAGLPVVLTDVSDERLQSALGEVRRTSERALRRQVARGRMDEAMAAAEVDALLARVEVCVGDAGLADVDLAIEAVPEELELKRAVLARLDAATPGRALLATNTSALSVADVAAATTRPDRVVGLHFFNPVARMALVEVVDAPTSSRASVRAAVAFVQALRKQPIVCADRPGFVVNRILLAAHAELWRAQESGKLAIEAVDRAVVERAVLPMGPFAVADWIGLDVALHVNEHLVASLGDRFHVPAALPGLVAEGRLGAKTGQGGFFDTDGRPAVGATGEPDGDELAERATLALLAEACRVLEEGVATHRDIDVALSAGAGLDPSRGLAPPFLRADRDGLDRVVERMDVAAARHGEHLAPSPTLRRLVAQGRLGPAAGQGFYAHPRADAVAGAGGKVSLELRGEVAIAWLCDGPLNGVSRALVGDLHAAWERARAEGVRALVIASADPFTFSAGADLRTLDGDFSDGALIPTGHALFDELGAGPITTIAAVNGVAYGGGNELAMACDVRVAARSALFGQPEIKLGLLPGLGGTQRLRELVGAAKALELDLIGDPVRAEEALELGLVNAVVDDHDLLDVALGWARRMAAQPPLAVAQIKRLVRGRDLAHGLAAEREAFAQVRASEDAAEGIAAFLARRRPVWHGR